MQKARQPRQGRSSIGELIDRLFPDPQDERRTTACLTPEELECFVVGKARGLLKQKATAHLQRCRECRVLAEGLRELIALERGELDESSLRAPRHVADVPFVLSAKDVCGSVERAFAAKALRVEPNLNIVPDFFKRERLSCGLAPQQYLAAVLTALAYLSPPQTAIGVSALRGVFILRLGTRCFCRMTDKTLVFRCPKKKTQLNSILFLICHPVWLSTGRHLRHMPIALPLPQATQIKNKATLGALKSMDEFFSEYFPQATSKRSAEYLAALAHALHEEQLPPEAISERLKGDDPPRVPWADLLEILARMEPGDLSLQAAVSLLTQRNRSRTDS